MDNLKLIENDIDVFIDPNGAPGSILAENNQTIFKAILEKVGKYTGSPFIAKRNLTLFSPGDLSWNGNAMNNETEFIISVSKLTTDLNDIGLLLDMLILNDIIQFKDYVGRSVFLTYKGHAQETDGNGAIYYDISVVGFSTNVNYTYQVNETQICVVSFHKKVNEFEPQDLQSVTNVGSSTSNYSEFSGGIGTTEIRVLGVDNYSSIKTEILTDDRELFVPDEDGTIETKENVVSLLANKADLVGGLVPPSQLPSYVDDVLEFANLASFPVTGETGKIYLALDMNKTYRWTGSLYVQLSSGIEFPSDGKIYGVKDGLPIDLGYNIDKDYPNFIIMQEIGNAMQYLGTYAHVSAGTQSVVVSSQSLPYRKYLSPASAGSWVYLQDSGIYRVSPTSGFYYRARIKNEDASNIPTARFSYGFCGTAVITNTNPSTYVQVLLSFACDGTDSNCQIMYKNGLGATTKIDLGATMPKSSTDDYIIEFFREKNTTLIFYKVTNTTTNAVVSGSFTFAINALSLGLFRNNESVAVACAFLVRRVELYITD